MSRGKAQPGDKTMVDALHPAAAAAEAAAGGPLTEAMAAAAIAAEAGKEASKAMVAVFGRARSLGEGAIGFPDAGALSVTVILEAMRDFVVAR
jgi:dihydroxyacetone kinase